eukprot:GFUD01136736.1.p1 GENE.GFUD01136736.1~~GFUD01136736.1.p1  ORF type:complete len:506 (+),score=198.93 GFUD01136736.1:188-1705(+)
MKELIEQSESLENKEATEHSETTEISEQTFPGDNTSISDMESELQTDQSVQGSPFGNSAAMENSSPTNSGPDSEAASLDDLPKDDNKADIDIEEGYKIDEDISNKMAAATSYVGSFFNPSAWKAEKSPEGENKETKPTSRKNSVSAGGMMSSSFLTAFGKVPGFTKVSPTDEAKTIKEGEATATSDEEKNEEKKEESVSQGSFFTSAFSKIGISGMASSLTMENIAGKPAAAASEVDEDKEGEEKKEETWGSSFSNAFNKVGKVATDYTKVVQDTVYKAPMLAEFNQEQEEFIKSKGEREMPTAPWSGYQNEDELKDKILALSEDKRNFLRAPPTGVNFDFEYSAVASHALVLLDADPRLQKMRYELVPKKVKEDEFWRNYFYRVGLVKQSFELSNSMSTDVKKEKQNKSVPKPVDDDSDNPPTSADQDDEFVSDLHQASSKDLAEADEAMKKLGLSKNDAEWEAELEGELNEYEMVGDEDGAENPDNPEWENQIQEMLEAESKK